MAAGTAATALVVDGLVYRYFGTGLDKQVLASALYDWADARPIIYRLLPAACALIAGVAALEFLIIPRGGLPLPRRLRLGVLALAIGSMAVARDRDLSPEVRAAQAIEVLWQPKRARTTATESVPALPSWRQEVPSVVFVLSESVRSTSYCRDPGEPCPFAPEVDALFPDRVPLHQLRSIASYTMLSVSALLTGRPPALGSLEAAPLLFDYVHETRIDGRAPWVAYLSAQAATVVGRDVRASVDSLVTLETLVGRSLADEDDAVEEDVDGRLSARCVADVASMPRPLFLMLHLLGTHAPYYVDPSRAPFQPTQEVVTWAGLPDLRNRYEDSVVAQDHALAACLRAFLASQAGRPWVVLFTSDHGEAFGEHGAIHHGQNLYDEQIHVPGWVATSDGAVSREQAENLRAHRDAFLTHLDVVPTILDLFGVLDSFPLASRRSSLPGRSLFAPPAPHDPVPMTNCTTTFPCPLNTWGLQGMGHALVAQPWDADWNCVDLASGRERTGDSACVPLREASRRVFSTMPDGNPNAGR
jgi:hypothetical protein